MHDGAILNRCQHELPGENEFEPTVQFYLSNAAKSFLHDGAQTGCAGRIGSAIRKTTRTMGER
jgi:hypothetical protein